MNDLLARIAGRPKFSETAQKLYAKEIEAARGMPYTPDPGAPETDSPWSPWMTSALPWIVGGLGIMAYAVVAAGLLKGPKMTKLEKAFNTLLGALCEKLEQLENENERLRDDAAKAREELRADKKSHVELQSAVDELTDRLKIAQREIETRQRLAETEIAKVNGLHDEIAVLQDQLAIARATAKNKRTPKIKRTLGLGVAP